VGQPCCARNVAVLIAAALATAALSDSGTASPRNAASGNSTIAIQSPAQPAADYVLHCRGCHGPQGGAVEGKVPPLANAVGRFMRSEAGRDYVLRVPGVANAALSDERLAAVLNWTVEQFDSDNVTTELRRFTAAEVSRARRRPLLSVLAARRDVIRVLAATGPAPPVEY
jgi:hypothetical protein